MSIEVTGKIELRKYVEALPLSFGVCEYYRLLSDDLSCSESGIYIEKRKPVCLRTIGRQFGLDDIFMCEMKDININAKDSSLDFKCEAGHFFSIPLRQVREYKQD